MTTKTITIRNVPESVHRFWRVRAARNDRSLEAELRATLQLLSRPKKAARREAAAQAVDHGPSAAMALTQADRAAETDDVVRHVRSLMNENAKDQFEKATQEY